MLETCVEGDDNSASPARLHALDATDTLMIFFGLPDLKTDSHIPFFSDFFVAYFKVYRITDLCTASSYVKKITQAIDISVFQVHCGFLGVSLIPSYVNVYS